MRGLPWIGFAQVAGRWPEFEWIAASVPREQVAITVNGGPAYTEVVTRANGVGLMTCLEGDARPDLRRLSGPRPLIVREIWGMVQADQRRNAAVRKSSTGS
jgi:DNA-binding transcriptional LysR family regulator